MKTVLILGDSWGVPNYEGPACGAEPHEHTEYRLRELGYKVYNCAMNAYSNYKSLELAKTYLSGQVVQLAPHWLNNTFHKIKPPERIDKVDPKIDLIVWFHTESMRFHFDPNKTVQENLVDGYALEYAAFSKFFNQYPNSKIAIIGGQAPIYEPLFHNYVKRYDLLIEDWRSEIIGRPLSPVYWCCKPEEWVHRSTDSKENKIIMLDQLKDTFDAMRDSPDFIDNCHPAGRPHKELTDRLHKLMKIDAL